MVVAENSAPVKGKSIEVIGMYNPSEGKRFEVQKERLDYWISVGAKPSDSVAGLLKFNGVSGMESFMAPRTKTRPKKNPTEAEIAAAEAAKNPAPAVEEVVEEEVAAPEEAPAEDVAAEEPAAEEPTA